MRLKHESVLSLPGLKIDPIRTGYDYMKLA